MDVGIKAAHEDIERLFLRKLRRLSPFAICALHLENLPPVCHDLVLRVSRLTEGQVGNTVLVAAKHLCIGGEDVPSELHCRDHSFWLSFKEATAPSSEDSVSSEYTPVDTHSLLVSFREGLSHMLHIFVDRASAWLK